MMISPSFATEQYLAFVSLCINVVLVLSVPWRLWQLHHSPTAVQRSCLGKLKTISIVFLTIVNFTLLFRSIKNGAIFVIAISTSSAASLGLSLLSWHEHRRSVRPSDLIISYLLASIVVDAILLTVPGLRLDIHRPILLGRLVVYVIVGFLECRGKESILLEKYKGFPPEEATSFLGRTFFWWVNPVLAEGYKNVLVGHQLPSTDQRLSPGSLRRHILHAWAQRAKPESRGTLPTVLLQCLMRPFIAVIIPRLFLITFRFGQPVLIRRAIRFVVGPFAAEEPSVAGYWIIISAIIVYIGLAVSTATYQRGLNRVEVMIRGSLVGLIHSTTLIGRDEGSDDGKIVTLMSNDVSNLESSARMFHETWAQLLEVATGVTLLAREVGWVWPLPLFIIALGSQTSRFVAKNLRSRQGKWNAATQDRISLTSSVLGSIKTIKMAGLQDAVKFHIQKAREREMDAAASVRWMMFAYGVSANAVGLFTPVFTLVLYAALQEWRGLRLDTETAFTTYAILAMVTHPANMVMTIVPRAIASLSSFERIQNYLLDAPSEDRRITKPTPGTTTPISNGTYTAEPAIQFEAVTLAYKSNPRVILRDINFKIPRSSVIICTGAVGSGKTTLVRAILGEIPHKEGAVTVASKRIGYCSQIPWLPSSTISDIIYGPIPEHARDVACYQQAIKTCRLDQDIKLLPKGDCTVVGSKGMNLSGGQRQRVALARTIYAQHDIAVIDDTFSGLDNKTETEVVNALLGPNGLFRKRGITVFWVTTATKHFPLADTVIVLGDSKIQEQGPWETLKAHSEQISQIIHSEDNSAVDVVTSKSPSPKLQSKSSLDEASKDLRRKNGDISLYGYYFKSAGLRNILIMTVCTASYSLFNTFSQYWLKWWTESKSSNAAAYMAGYFALLLAAWLSTDGNMWSTGLLIAPTSGISLHNRLLHAIMGAPLLYFSGTQSGNILNRFGQDIQLVDQQLAPAATSVITQMCKLSMQAAILIAVQYLMALTLPFCAIVVYIVQKVYLRTSRQLRFLELESRSAVYSSFLETVQGIATIRAFGWQKETADDNIKHLDDSQRPFYLLFCLQRWLNIVLDLLIATLAITTISLAVAFRGSTTGGQVGVALNLIIVANTTLLSLVVSFTNLEIGLGAIARLKEVESSTPKESPTKPLEAQNEAHTELPPTWPSSGEVEFSHLTAAYNADAIALRDVVFRIGAGQTAVVCGRTGSGKSSLLLTLLRLLDVQSGCIKVDGISINNASHDAVRRRAFVTVSQDPFLLPDASLRFNLDPYLEVPESLLVTMLKHTGLWLHFACADPNNTVDENDLDEVNGLFEHPLSALPSLSVGQSQLLSLTRALIQLRIASGQDTGAYSDAPRGKPIVLLDEVTASLDPRTESDMYDIIEEEIIKPGHTVIMVTHKIGAFARRMRPGKDMVVWMSDGRVEKIGGAEDILDTPP